jgi:hypothetical protein
MSLKVCAKTGTYSATTVGTQLVCSERVCLPYTYLDSNITVNPARACMTCGHAPYACLERTCTEWAPYMACGLHPCA